MNYLLNIHLALGYTMKQIQIIIKYNPSRCKSHDIYKIHYRTSIVFLRNEDPQRCFALVKEVSDSTV